MLEEFRLEAHFAIWEFKARHHVTASDAQTLSLSELLALGTQDERNAFLEMPLGYTQTRGSPVLRQEIASTYDHRSAEDILCFAGAEEGIYATLSALLDDRSHAVVVLPAYQSLESIPRSICATAGIPMRLRRGWQLDLDRVKDSIRPNTRAVIINFPNNPTGALLPDGQLNDLVGMCASRGIWLFSDEAYRPLGPAGGRQSPHVADLYERGISLGVMSKAYGLPGLRVGWIACADHSLLDRAERIKHYLSICNAGPSEHLATVALKARQKILARNCGIVTEGIVAWGEFFGRRPELFDWIPPVAGCVAYPRFKGSEGIEDFARDLVEQAGVLVLPASIFRSSLALLPDQHFRVGAGRLGLADGLAAFERFLVRRGR